MKGFTLVELLVTMAVITILLLMAIPAFNSFVTHNRVLTQVNQLVSAINFARSEAIKRHGLVTLCASRDGLTCIKNWREGWIIYVEKDHKVLRAYGPLPDNDQLVWRGSLNKPYLQMSSTGGTHAQAGTFIYCPSNKNAEHYRAVVITQAGHVRIAQNDDAEGKPLTCGG